MKSFIIIPTFLILSISCERECPIENQKILDQSVAGYTLIAGDALSDSINYYEFDPYISVKGKRMGVDSNYTFSDSVWLDLNMDNINDLYFKFYRSHFQPSCDCEGIDCCMPSDDLYCLVRSNSNVEIASVESYSYNLPIRFSIGDSIDDRFNWMNYEAMHHFALVGLTGGWNTDNFNSFMGVRLKTNSDTVYSWIRINTHYLNSIDIYDYAIEK